MAAKMADVAAVVRASCIARQNRQSTEAGKDDFCNEEKFSIFAAVFRSYPSFSFEFHQDGKPIVNNLINNNDSLSGH